MPDPDDLGTALQQRADGVTVTLRVVPRAPRTELVGLHGRACKLKVAAPPVDGAANEAVRRWLAGICGVRPGQVEVVAGARSRDKVVLVHGARLAEVVDALAQAR